MAAVRSVKQREYELIARLAAAGGQQQRRRRDLASLGDGYLVHVPVGSAARKIAVRVLDHPVRQVRSEFRFSHRALSSKLQGTYHRAPDRPNPNSRARRFGTQRVTTLLCSDG